MKVGQHFNAKLMQQRSKLNTRLLRHQSLQSKHLARVVLGLRNDARQKECRKGTAVQRHTVTAEASCSDKCDNKGGNAMQVLQRFYAMRNRMLLGVLQRKAVARLKHTL